MVEGRLVLGADGFHRQSAGEGHGGRQLAAGIQPDDLTAELKLRDGVSIQAHALAGKRDGVAAGDRDACVGRFRRGAQNREARRLAVSQPVAEHHHLHGEGRVAEAHEIAWRSGEGAFAIVLADRGGGGSRVHHDGTGGAGIELVPRGGEIAIELKSGRDGAFGAAVGLFGRSLQQQRCIGRACDFVALFADGMKDQVECELALFSGHILRK